MFNSRYASSNMFSVDPSIARFSEVPKLMIGFDTETTGLWAPPIRCKCLDHMDKNGLGREVRDCEREAPKYQARDLDFTSDIATTKGYKDTSFHEPITYGFTVYRDGKPTGIKTNFVVKPSDYATKIMAADPNKFAIRTHGWTPQMLRDSYNGAYIINGPRNNPANYYTPAVDRETGMTNAASQLGEWLRQGGVIVGANVRGFDLGMLEHHIRRTTGESLSTFGVDLSKAPIIDVIRHHEAMNPNNSEEKFRPLSDSKIKAKFRDTLCDIYGVEQGDHSAAEDARASIDVALRQIATNRGEIPVNTYRRFSRQRRASVGPSGLDYSQFTPCSGNSNCGTCKHIQNVMNANKDPDTGRPIDVDADAMHKQQLITHQDTIPNMVKEQQ